MDLEDIYAVKKENWYEAKPYGFRHKDTIMFLPISPSNLTVSTNFATNVVSTLYGTVEEHSEVKYYDIVIEGTTGIAPKYIDPLELAVERTGASETKYLKEPHASGRESFAVSTVIPPFLKELGLFKKTLNLIEKAANKASEILKQPSIKSGVDINKTGYMAFHNLYRFLLSYKEDMASNSGNLTPLVFFNYKDNIEYSVAIRNFSLRRSAENPMLYYYSITMRGYDMGNISEDQELFSEQEKLDELGLNGVKSSSILGKIKKTASKARSLVNIAGGIIPNFGK